LNHGILVLSLNLITMNNQTLTILDFGSGEVHQYHDINYDKYHMELDEFVSVQLGYNLNEVEYMFHTDKTIYDLTNEL